MSTKSDTNEILSMISLWIILLVTVALFAWQVSGNAA
jgi:hypothetical protein